MKTKPFILLLGTLLIFILLASVSTFASPQTSTIVDEMDGFYTPAHSENLTLNAQDFLASEGFQLDDAIDQTIAVPTEGDTATIYYKAHSFSSVEISWYSSWGAYVTQENGRYRIGGDVTKVLPLPLYISDFSGETHFYILTSTGEIYQTDYLSDVNPTLPFFSLVSGITPAEVLSMKPIGGSVLGSTTGPWDTPWQESYHVTLDIGADPPLYYHTLTAEFPDEVTTLQVNFTGLELFPEFTDSYYFDLPMLTALGRVRATGDFSSSSSFFSETDSSDNENSSQWDSSASASSSTLSSMFSSEGSSENLSSVTSSSPLESTNSSTLSSNFSSSLPWGGEFGNNSLAQNRGQAILRENSQIYGYIPSSNPEIPISANSSFPAPPNYNPNWSGTRIIRPYTVLKEMEVSSETAENISDISSYTVISGRTSSDSGAYVYVLLGVSSLCLMILGIVFWKSKKE